MGADVGPTLASAMKVKLKSEEAKTQYEKCKQTVEPVFSIIKGAMGLRLRGLINAATERSLIALAYNCRRIVRLQAA
jgi:hypothetical protein